MIHKYKLAGYNIVLDVNSGGVHVVDDLTYDILDNINPPFSETCPENVVEKLMKFYRREDIESCYSEVRQLYQNKILFCDRENKEKGTARSLGSMCLNISHDCNLRCEYCFASSGDFGDSRSLMTSETGKKAVDFLIERSGERKELEIDFFGGEPLLNFNVMKDVILYARSKEHEFEKKFIFTITTNGTLLNDFYIDFINKEMSCVVLSIDGRKEINDRMRKNSGGKGCYDTIIPLYQKLVNGRQKGSYYVRGTYTKYNLDFCDDVFSLYDKGFENISIEPVISKPDYPYSITECDLPEIFREYEELAIKISSKIKEGKEINFFHFKFDLDNEPYTLGHIRGCGCANEYLAVTPDGSIYPCHMFVGIPEYKMGNIHTNKLDAHIMTLFSGADVNTKTECKKCWAKYYCSGGCNANNYLHNGDIYMSHKLSCQIMKKRIECAIMIKALQYEEDSMLSD